ncbi:MAG: 2-haloalkanoic acid dehalogenase [Proteobacteria bacterium SG_bin9]|nr:MAG: 2-haloalkanoic acid dehalogenase [Proteobacteria bacterium SG_bin9]
MSATSPTIAVFDIGKVLLDWDPRHLYRKMFDDGARMEAFLADVCTMDWILEFDRGAPFATAIPARIKQFPHYEREIRAFDERWLETLVGVLPGSMALLKTLQAKGVPNYAITNYSAEKFEESRPHYPFLDSFDGIVVSGREKLLKPDAAIYRLFLDRFRLKAEDCLFIDDSLKNAEGARTVGMHAHHFTGAEGLHAELKRHGFPV